MKRWFIYQNERSIGSASVWHKALFNLTKRLPCLTIQLHFISAEYIRVDAKETQETYYLKLEAVK